MQIPLNNIMEKEMDRRQFLVHIGASLMAILGFSTIIKVLTTDHSSKTSTKTYGGYGGGAYGR